MFRFKQFTVNDSRSALKVGTDGVLIGAWARVEPDDRQLLDVGAGCGVIALMMAQKSSPEAHISAVEIDHGSVGDARDNVASGPWPGKVEVFEESFDGFAGSQKGESFDVVVSNPPYFVDSLECPDPARYNARHAASLTHAQLIEGVWKLLVPRGRFSVILPCEVSDGFERQALGRGFFVGRRCMVRTTAAAPPRRVMLELVKTPVQTHGETLTIELKGGAGFTPEYMALTRDFYLKF